MRSLRLQHIVSLACAIWPMTVPAQSREQNAGQQTRGESSAIELGQLEEVRVSAKRYDTDLQTTSVAVSAFTAADLAAAGVNDTRDLALFTPSLTIGGDSQLGNFPIVLRGVGNNDSDGPSQDAPIAVYVDGVYQARPFQNAFELADIERVEVLRGPQGTLFGRNAAGGALNYVSRQPTDTAQGSATVGFARYDSYEANGFFMTPLNSNWGIKLAAGTRESGGWTENQLNGGETPRERSKIFRGSVRYQNGGWDVIFAASTGQLNFTSAINNPSFLPDVGPDYVALDAPQYEEREFSDASITVNQESNLGVFTAIAAWQESSALFSWDADGSAEPLIQFGPLDLQSEVGSLELRLRSDSNQRFRWVVGAYYFRETGSLAGPVRAGPGFTGLPEYITATLFDNDAATTSISGFSEVYYDVTPKLTLAAGLRYTRDEKQNTNRDMTQPNPLRYAASDTWSEPTPRVVAEYKATDDVFVYASASKGFRSGTWAISGTSPIAADPETIWSYEAGVKTELLDRSLRVNMAAYYMDYKDKQERVITGIGITETRNATGARIEGAEVEFTFLPTAHLRLGGFANYLHATFGQFIDLGPDGSVAVLTDKFLPRSPEWKYALMGQYEFEFGNGQTLTPRIEWSHESQSFFSRRNADIVGTDGWDVVNFKLLWSLNDRWSATAYVDNLGDERYKNNVSDVENVGLGTPTLYSAPRQWGLKVSYKY